MRRAKQRKQILCWASRHKVTKVFTVAELLTGATLKAEAEAHSAARERALNFMVVSLGCGDGGQVVDITDWFKSSWTR